MPDTIMSVIELGEVSAMRESVYRLLSSLYFKELTAEQIDYLASIDWADIGELDELIGEGCRNIKRSLRRINSGTREDLAVDYAHTFLAAGTSKDEARACPYESIFTSRDGLIMQEARDDVYRYMLTEHLCPDESLRIPEDHIAFVFEFMANLCVRFNEARSKGDFTEMRRVFGIQKEFFEKHIGGWIDLFCDAVESCCRTDFYRGVSQITRGFVRIEYQLLDEMAKAVEQ